MLLDKLVILVSVLQSAHPQKGKVFKVSSEAAAGFRILRFSRIVINAIILGMKSYKNFVLKWSKVAHTVNSIAHPLRCQGSSNPFTQEGPTTQEIICETAGLAPSSS